MTCLGRVSPFQEALAAMDGGDAVLEEEAGVFVLSLEKDTVSIEADDHPADALPIDLHDFDRLLGLQKTLEDLLLEPVRLWFLLRYGRLSFWH